MDSDEFLRKALRSLEGTREDARGTKSWITRGFNNLIALKNKNKINFDLESFLTTSWRDLESLKADNDGRDGGENCVKEKKRGRKLLNLSILRLWELLDKEEHFEASMDRLLELLDLQYCSEVESRGLRSFDFLELFLNLLFLGDFYNLGVVQHFLINSKYTLQLPCALNNVIRNFQRTEKLNELLNGDRALGKEVVYERCLIFISKLKRPEEFTSPLSPPREEKLLRIPKKEMALKNKIDYLEKRSNDEEEMEDYEEDSSVPSEEESEIDEENKSEDGKDEEDMYTSDYRKLWDGILNDLLYRLSDMNLVIVLESIPTRALPYLHNPLRIVDFLYENLNSKMEEVAINSLNCLFELILYHNLTDQMIKGEVEKGKGRGGEDQFDWFYSKLYEFVEFNYLSSGSNVVLVLLLEKALNSSMLPNELLASFIKKMVKAATVLETNTCNCLLIISLNLLQKHYHNLLYLIHTPVQTENSKNGTHAEEGLGDGCDRKAEQLFLHELYLLLRHFSQDTAKIVGIFFTDLRSRDRVTFNMRDFIGNEHSSHHIEKSRKTNLNVFKSTAQRSTNLTKEFFQSL